MMTRRILIAALILLGACSINSAPPAEPAPPFPYEMDEDGTIPVWMINGPYAPEAPALVPNIAQPEKPPISPIMWKPAVATHDGKIHFSQAYRGSKAAATAYAFAHVYSPVETTGYLSFGFKDTIHAWWNGQLVAEEKFAYMIWKDWRRAKIRIKKGLNTCLVRLDRTAGGYWGFTARVTDATDHMPKQLFAALPIPAEKEPFGVNAGERPSPLTHNFVYPVQTGSSTPAERGIYFIGNQLSRSMIVLDDETENGLEFDFHDGILQNQYETFIPEFSRLSVETSRGIFLCTNGTVTNGTEPRTRVLGEIPGSILKVGFTPTDRTGQKTCRLSATATYFMPPDLNATGIRVEVTNTQKLPVAGIMLQYSFITRDNRFEKVEEDDEFIVLRGTGGKRWIALAARPHHPLTISAAFPYRNGTLNSVERRQALARRDVFYSGKPALNAYVRLSSNVDNLAPGRKAVSYFLIAAGRTKREAVQTLKRCMHIGEKILLAETRKHWSNRSKNWVKLETQDERFNDVYTYSRNYLGALIDKSGFLSAGFYQSYSGAWIRDTVMCTTGMTLAGQQAESLAALEHLLLHIPPKSGQWEEIGMLLYGLWHYRSFTGDDSLAQAYTAKIAGWADKLVNRIGDGQGRPPLIQSKTEGYWERPWLGEGLSFAQNAWAVIGLERMAELLEGTNDVRNSEFTRWAAAAKRCRGAMLTPGPYTFIREGRLVKRLKLDGTVQQFGLAEPGGAQKALEPDMAVVDAYLWGLVDPHSEVAIKTTAFLSRLWNGGWTFGGAARYNVASDPDGPTAGPWPFATLMFAQGMLLQDQYAGAMQLTNWTAHEGARGFTWPERISMSAARDRDARYRNTVLTWPWGEWLQTLLRTAAGLRPTKDGLKLEPHLPEAWANLKLTRVTFRGFHYNITYKGWGNRIQSVTFNGKKWDEKTLPLENGTVEVELARVGKPSTDP